jgi:23S rRNA (cytidine1920-2'-O)/16S rRNA (cytidine1409-2'-O)-methyltransferase
VTLDLSFISVLKVMPALAAVMAPGAQMVVLIKPQFEAGRAQVGTGGLVKDPQVG